MVGRRACGRSTGTAVASVTSSVAKRGSRPGAALAGPRATGMASAESPPLLAEPVPDGSGLAALAREAARDGAVVGLGGTVVVTSPRGSGAGSSGWALGETVVVTSPRGSGAGSSGWALGALACAGFGWATVGLFGVAAGFAGLGGFVALGGFAGLGFVAVGGFAGLGGFAAVGGFSALGLGVCANAVPAPITATANTRVRTPAMLLVLMRSPLVPKADHPCASRERSVFPGPTCRADAPRLRIYRTLVR